MKAFCKKNYRSRVNDYIIYKKGRHYNADIVSDYYYNNTYRLDYVRVYSEISLLVEDDFDWFILGWMVDPPEDANWGVFTQCKKFKDYFDALES